MLAKSGVPRGSREAPLPQGSRRPSRRDRLCLLSLNANSWESAKTGLEQVWAESYSPTVIFLQETKKPEKQMGQISTYAGARATRRLARQLPKVQGHELFREV